jgi:hypothetical protein
MTTTGSSGFNLDVSEIIEEAFERCGAELRTGYDFRTARRSLDLITIEWANRGINLWTIEQGAVPLVQGQSEYNIPADTIDLLEHVIRTNTDETQQDLSISRISASTYAVIPNKNAQGRPIQVWVNRQSGAQTPSGLNSPKVVLYPTPDQDGKYSFVYWRMRRIQDAGGGINTQDIPFRFLNCLIAGLAYYLSMKLQGAAERAPMLKAQYEEQWKFAADEDREKAPLRIVPRRMYLGGG